MHAVLLGNDATTIDRVYGEGRRQRLAAAATLHPQVIGDANAADHADALAAAEAAFTTWGIPKFMAADPGRLPRLKAIFYAAGSVQHFARPWLDRGVTVVSAWHANGQVVAEYTLAQVLLGLKGYFLASRLAAAPDTRGRKRDGGGILGGTVALLGAGAVGRGVIRLLRTFPVNLVVFDSFLSDDDAAEMGVAKVSLEEAFRAADVVSNHLANNAQTVGMLHGGLFATMRDEAVFINTGRGAQVREDELVAELRRRPTLTAVLDVTHPEPPAADSPLYGLPNVVLTPHIAGAMGRDVVRMADVMIEEYRAFVEGRPLRFAVNQKMLATMA